MTYLPWVSKDAGSQIVESKGKALNEIKIKYCEHLQKVGAKEHLCSYFLFSLCLPR